MPIDPLRRRWPSVLRALALAAICLLLTGCSREYYLVIFNAGATALHVEYTVDRRIAESGMHCSPEILPGYDADRIDEHDLRYDTPRAGVVEIVVAPGAAVLVCHGMNERFDSNFPLSELKLRTNDGAAQLSGTLLKGHFDHLDNIMQLTVP